uniref:MoaB/Mog domain-containing protein n=1 Tax=Onchocerca volvulus TaxID=6282 RepID=A0A8R1TWH6_ONCVO
MIRRIDQFYSHSMSTSLSAIVYRSRQSVWPAVSVKEAMDMIEEHAFPVNRTRTVLTSDVKTGDVLAENVIAPRALPEVRTSVKDGYAVIASDGKGIRKVVSGTTAGVLASDILRPGTICRVNTGSMIPDGADAVVQVENTRIVEHNNFEEVAVEILDEPEIGQDIRQIGSDIKLGEILLFKGCVLSAAEIGILAASERHFVKIFRKPKVAVISTGHEVVDSRSNNCTLGSVRDTNRPQLIALLKENNFKHVDIGILPDEKEKIEEGLKTALTLADVVVCSGGVSMGEKDYLKDVLQKQLNFTIKFGRVMIKPGLPTTFAHGKWNNTEKLIFALPGNPVSTWVASQLFVLPMLKKMAGWQRYQHTVISVRLSETIKLDRRPEYRRACLLPDPENLPRAICLEKEQMSSRLLSVRGANLLLKLPSCTDTKSTLQKDEVVDAVVIDRL